MERKAPAKTERLVDLMLDSGAFSVQFTGEKLDIQKYIEFVKEHKEHLWIYVNLDVVPGKPNQKNTQEDVEQSAADSYQNLQIMKKAGLAPLPVFHMGERWYWLEKLLGDGEPYIGLSTNKNLFPKAHRAWLDQAWTIITKKDGTPLVKTHGFGITTHYLLVRYPWTTCDSTTWSLSAGYGKIFVPAYEGGKPNYFKPPITVIVSGVPQKSASRSSMQYESFGPVLRKHVLEFLDEMKMSIADVRNDDGARRRAIVHYYKMFEKHVVVTKFEHRQRSFGFVMGAHGHG